jgi:hypothetical protein
MSASARGKAAAEAGKRPPIRIGSTDYEVLWQWAPPADRYTERERWMSDICDEYAVVSVESATGIMLVGRHGSRWVANPSARAVIAEFVCFKGEK